ncbi:transposase [Umezawaea sp.]|uniref:transposase n=1 Tax=Umezawaea sp. TaxID=1955258 RepID=UPI0039C8E155
MEPLPPVSGAQHRPLADDRRVINGMLFKATTGTAWRDLPQRHPHHAGREGAGGRRGDRRTRPRGAGAVRHRAGAPTRRTGTNASPAEGGRLVRRAQPAR